MSRLGHAFARCQEAGRPAFIPFITSGDPNLDATGRIITDLVVAGADLIEIGFPYSDPLADGPVIQASYTRALAANTTLEGIFSAAALWTAQHPQIPFIAMTSYSLVFRMGLPGFLVQLVRSGFSGLIVPDLPIEEAPALARQAQEHGVALVQLVSPTTPKDRAFRITQLSSGFLYVMSVTGITGTRDDLPAELTEQLAALRTMTNLPLCVGFGISKPEQVLKLRKYADGVIVGSALVRCLEGEAPLEEKLNELKDKASELRLALNP